MSFVALPTRRQALATCALAVVAVAISGCILAAAVLSTPPPAILPLLTLVCVGCPMALGWSLPTSVAVLRSVEPRLDGRAVRTLRRHLDRLPETQHPLGL
jgi:hydrogenase/urease accessory protein HupE